MYLNVMNSDRALDGYPGSEILEAYSVSRYSRASSSSAGFTMDMILHPGTGPVDPYLRLAVPVALLLEKPILDGGGASVGLNFGSEYRVSFILEAYAEYSSGYHQAGYDIEIGVDDGIETGWRARVRLNLDQI